LIFLRVVVMSAWPSSVTRLATAKVLWETSTKLFSMAYGSTVYPHLDPDESATGWTRATEWVEVAADLGWEMPDEEPGGLFSLGLDGVTSVSTGLEAIFFFTRAVETGTVRFADAVDYQKLDMSVEAIVNIVAPSTQITPARFVSRALQEHTAATNHARRFYNASDALVYLKGSYAWEEFEDETYPRGITAWSGLLAPRRLKGFTMFKGIGPYANKVLVLTDASLDVLIAVMDRLASLADDVGRRYADRPAVAEQCLSLMHTQILRCAELSGSAANKACAAWHEVRTYVQYTVLKSIMADAVMAVDVEYRTSGYDQVIPLATAVMLVTNADTAVTMDLVHVYKWIPPTEYDTTRALPIIRDLHMKPRVSGASPNASDESKAIYKEIQAERKVNLVSAFYRQNGVYPPDLVKKKGHPTIAEIIAWPAKDVYRYETLGSQIANQVKDKTTVYASMEEEINGRKDMFNQNYLMWYLANWESVDTCSWLTQFAEGTLPEDNYVRVAYKGEAQKEYSRPFFMLPPKTRTILGEFEGNLSRIARYYPAVLMGKPSAAQDALMDTVMDPYTAANADVPDAVSTTYIVMFDVSKWSPKSDGNQVAEYHDFWAGVFGDSRLRSLATIGCKSTILNTTDRVVFSYQNQGADLEGFRGRMGSMYHADLLATACRRSVKKGYITGKSNLVVFIDDGAVKIEAVGEGEVAEANARAFLEEMKRVYTAGGQEIHTRKVVISQVGGEILANFYLNGVRVPQGIKAAMKMTPDYTNPVSTLPEHMDSAFAAAQGALKAGTDPFTTYSRYVRNCMWALHKMDRRCLSDMDADKLAVMAITPKSMGGLGIQSVQGLCTTTVTNMTSEGLSMLNRAGRYYPKLRAWVTKVVSRPILAREPLAILRDPVRVRTNTPALVESRLVRYVMDKLTSEVSQFARLLGGVSTKALTEHATNVAKAILESGTLSVPLINKAWKATPLCEVETIIAKFKRSDAIISLIGYKGVGSIRSKNLSDVKKVVAATALLLV